MAKGNLPFEASQYVNKVGKYLYNKLKKTGCAYKFETYANTCNVHCYVAYEKTKLENLSHNPSYAFFDLDTICENHRVDMNINITTYQNKLRVNVINDDAMEKTIGHIVLKPEELTDYNKVLDKIMVYIIIRLEKEYYGYEFTFF